MEIFEFGKSPSKTVFAKLQSGFSYEFKLGAEEKPRSAGEREKGRTGPGLLGLAS